MFLLKIILGYFIYKEIICYIVCGKYTVDINKVKSLLEQPHHINQYDHNMISVDKLETIFSKNISDTFWKWYFIDENGKRYRIFRWSKCSEYVDEVYNKLIIG